MTASPHPARWPAPTVDVCVPEAGAGTALEEHLNRVDAVLARTITELDRMWTDHLGVDHLGVGRRLAVLGEAHVPGLIGALLDGGGKRIRPTMAYLGWLAGIESPQDQSGRSDVVQVGAALEMLHVFALVHDDVMDQSATRRGRPTVHADARRRHLETESLGDPARFGDTVAILVGDLAHAEAAGLAAELPAHMRRIWRRLVVELTCGQLLDVVGSAAGTHEVPYSRMAAQLKSGRYTVERPLELGAAAASAGAAVRGALASYGQEIGHAFALRDDVLGAFGDPTATGKPAGDDLLAGKPTMLLTLAHQRMRTSRDRALLRRVGSDALGAAGVAALQERMHEVGLVNEVEALISGHVAAALSALEHGRIRPDAVEQLTVVAQRIAWRVA